MRLFTETHVTPWRTDRQQKLGEEGALEETQEKSADEFFQEQTL